MRDNVSAGKPACLPDYGRSLVYSVGHIVFVHIVKQML